MTKKNTASGNVSIEERLARAYRSLKGRWCRGLTGFDRDDIVSNAFAKDPALSLRTVDHQRRQWARETARATRRNVPLDSEIYTYPSDAPDPESQCIAHDRLNQTLPLLFEEMEKAFSMLKPTAHNLLVEEYQLPISPLRGAKEPLTEGARKKALQRARRTLAELLQASIEKRHDVPTEIREFALDLVEGRRFLNAFR